MYFVAPIVPNVFSVPSTKGGIWGFLLLLLLFKVLHYFLARQDPPISSYEQSSLGIHGILAQDSPTPWMPKSADI